MWESCPHHLLAADDDLFVAVAVEGEGGVTAKLLDYGEEVLLVGKVEGALATVGTVVGGAGTDVGLLGQVGDVEFGNAAGEETETIGYALGDGDAVMGTVVGGGNGALGIEDVEGFALGNLVEIVGVAYAVGFLCAVFGSAAGSVGNHLVI